MAAPSTPPGRNQATVIEELQKLEEREKQLKAAIDEIHNQRAAKLGDLYKASATSLVNGYVTPSTPGPSIVRVAAGIVPITPPGVHSPPATLATPATPSTGGLRRFSRSWTGTSTVQSPDDDVKPSKRVSSGKKDEEDDEPVKIQPAKKNGETAPKRPSLNPGKYTTVVCRRDGVWVELRCPLCNCNALKVSGAFFQGVMGFRTHLLFSHSLKVHVPAHRSEKDEVIKRCTYRVVSVDEVRRMSKGYKMPHIPAIQRKDNIENHAARHEIGTRDQKGQGGKILKWHAVGPFRGSSAVQATARDQPSLAPKTGGHARKRKTATADHLVGHQEISSKGQSNDSCTLAANDDEIDDVDFSPYCPCTLCGHQCLSPACTKIKICLSATHTSECLATLSHAVEPSCVSLMRDGVCRDDQCLFGHDCADQRKLVFHKHSHLNH